MVRLNRRPCFAALLAAVCFSPGIKASAAPIEIPVMTQNLYVGADATPVLANPTPATIQAAFNSVLANNFPARAAAIASEAASAGGPLLIGLQEASIISAPGSATLDYAQILINALAARGLNYSEAGVHTGFQISAAGFSLTDQEVVLARTGVAGFTATGTGHTFVNNVTLGGIPLQRGYILVNASLDGVPFEFVSTHLDETHSPANAAQAGEIIQQLDTVAEPQLVVGDFNANPNEPTYAEMLAAGFTDVTAALGAAGLTCCQSPDLDNPVSQLTNRYDYVFERGFSSLDLALLVGNTTPFENSRPLWPSDHAGVIAEVDLAQLSSVPEPPSMVLLISATLLAVGSRFRARR
jgi:endonuclease/exonuclease/phosphatase family metal-dependent hydrolase